MSARALGDILAGRETKHRRTFQPVRRSSYHVTDRRALAIWKPIADGTAKEGRKFWGALMIAAEKFDEEGKEPGKRNGSLGAIGLRVLRELGRMVDYRTGRLDPSIETLMMRTRRSRAAVCAALARLRDHGFIDWVRRTEPLDNPDPFGPQVRQATNAYGIDIDRLPDMAKRFVRQVMGWLSPLAARVVAARADRERKAAWMQMTTEEQVARQRTPADRAVWEALAASLDKAENAISLSGQNPGTEEPPDDESGG